MSEIIHTYTVQNPWMMIPQDRNDFYAEEFVRWKNGWTPERYIEVVYIFLFNEHGELIIQKRSKEKTHNPNLLDKSVGWHVQYGDTPNLTAMIETIQELQTPSIVLHTPSDFLRTYEVLKNYITTSALLQYIDTRDSISQKIIGNEIVSIWNRIHTYFGIYGWRVKNVDKEAKWILYYSLEDLTEEIELHPEIFTYDLCDALIRYSGDMNQFLASVWLK